MRFLGETKKGSRTTISGINFGQSEQGAEDIYGIREALSISGRPLLSGEFDISALQPQKHLRKRSYDAMVLTHQIRLGKSFGNGPILDGVLFNAHGYRQARDWPVLDKAFKSAAITKNHLAGGWDRNRFWIVVPEKYAAWVHSTLLQLCDQERPLYIGTTSSPQPSLFLLRQKELSETDIKQIATHFEIATIGGGA